MESAPAPDLKWSRSGSVTCYKPDALGLLLLPKPLGFAFWKLGVEQRDSVHLLLVPELDILLNLNLRNLLWLWQPEAASTMAQSPSSRITTG